MTQAEPNRAVRAADGASGRAPYVPALDGLRGIAILGVLLFHTDRLPGGFLGVDLFFALSGYLITDLLLREVAASGSVSLAAFWGRRIRRLFPALAAMLASVAVLVWALGPPDTVRTMLSDGPWVQVNLVNWHLLAESAGYWDRFGAERVFEHLWSIAVEEQFYLVWPLVLLAAARSARRPGRRGHPERPVDRRIAVASVAASAASLVLMVLLVGADGTSRVYMGTDTRAFSLLLGAAAATGPARALLAAAVGRWAGAAAAATAAAIAVIWLLADGADTRWLFTGGLFAHSLASALLIGLCVQAPRTRLSRALSWRPLRWLGLVSYSLYLWHWPVIVLLSPERTGLEGWARTAVVAAAAVALAALSKYLVEDPIRFRARWARGRSGAWAFAGAMVGLAVLWVVLPAPAPPAVDIAKLE
ncbi:acyltransferase family protein [Nocardiopsis halophila]|uniref:acyltransferase family protein n=1 Tax=Nocardiopsis halophila TaxID=141692 RepID=UPI000346C192|nr:acyltransferase [Nocardiopsis halophila]